MLRIRESCRWRAAAGALCLLVAVPAFAYDVISDSTDRDATRPRPATILPYGFHTELLETGIGVVRIKEGQWQPQDTSVLTAYGTSNESWGVGGALQRARLGNSRWFVNTLAYVQRNTEQRFYIEAGFRVNGTQRGSNESDEGDFLQGTGWNAYADAEFRYVLPIGLGRTDVVHRYETQGGLLTGGSATGGWNPLQSGRTMLVLKPFAMWRSLVVNERNIGKFPSFFPVALGQEVEHRSNGLNAFLEYDNRDLAVNPAGGSYQKLSISRDFGAFGSSNPWTAVEADVRKYFSLGRSASFRQRVLALNAWTAYSPTWRLTRVGDSFRIDNAPPENKGASLGGLMRMRGYPTGRFNDKAAVYYSAELRFIPVWNPMKDWPLLRDVSWRWWQWALSAEIGRVAPTWDASTLHRDMKWSIGASVRVMIGSGVGRIELAQSAESTEVVLMIGHPF